MSIASTIAALGKTGASKAGGIKAIRAGRIAKQIGKTSHTAVPMPKVRRPPPLPFPLNASTAPPPPLAKGMPLPPPPPHRASLFDRPAMGPTPPPTRSAKARYQQSNRTGRAVNAHIAGRKRGTGLPVHGPPSPVHGPPSPTGPGGWRGKLAGMPGKSKRRAVYAGMGIGAAGTVAWGVTQSSGKAVSPTGYRESRGNRMY